jgi:hypothetical protein
LVSVDAVERRHQRNLQIGLLASQLWRPWRGSDERQRALQLLDGFDQRRTGERMSPGGSPQPGSPFELPSLSTVARQKLRLVLRNVGKLSVEDIRDPGVQRAPGLAQQSTVGRILNKGHA